MMFMPAVSYLPPSLALLSSDASAPSSLIASTLEWIQHTRVGTTIRESNWAIMGYESVHLLGMALLGGAATLLAIAAARRRGLGGLGVSVLARSLIPLAGLGLLIMVISGSLMAWSMPYRYYPNPAFRLKMLLLVLAVTVSCGLWQAVHKQQSDTIQRSWALLAFALWLGVGLSGRWIGFF